MNIELLKSVLVSENIHFEENFSLSKTTFTKTGGTVDFFVSPINAEQLQITIKTCNSNDIPFLSIGNASNLIVSDSHLKGVVISLLKMNSIETNGNCIKAESGALLSDVSKTASLNSLAGLEFACGIPGSVGGAICMNAGAYGGEMKDVVTSVKVVTKDGEIEEIPASSMGFVYRNSFVKEKGYIVVEVTFELTNDSQEEIKEKVKHFTFLRESKQPLEYPSCGSVFKRPEGYFAGALIQNAGLQGYRIGGVEVSKKHAGFMVNVDSGTATDYEELIEFVQKKVFQQFGVELETEVKIIKSI